jgi:transcriptional regulator with XRE-family HTH domain
MLEPGRQDEQRATLAEMLRELRRAAGLSGERLAARCAMSQAKISRIETGKVLASVIDVEQIVAALGHGTLAGPKMALWTDVKIAGRWSGVVLADFGRTWAAAHLARFSL